MGQSGEGGPDACEAGLGADLEEAARVAGAGWFYAYYRIWLPLMLPTLVMLATLNFVSAANATSSIILIASRDTKTLSILALEYRLGAYRHEWASVVAIILMLLTIALSWTMRAYAQRVGIRHR
jgi:iron(III) transport system permease protein